MPVQLHQYIALSLLPLLQLSWGQDAVWNWSMVVFEADVTQEVMNYECDL